VLPIRNAPYQSPNRQKPMQSSQKQKLSSWQTASVYNEGTLEAAAM